MPSGVRYVLGPPPAPPRLPPLDVTPLGVMGAEVLGSWSILGSRPPLGVDGALVVPNLGIGQGASCGGLGAAVRGVRAPKRREKSPRLRLRSAWRGVEGRGGVQGG